MPPLALLTTYFNFNANPWMEQNVRYTLRKWRAAGAWVALVEFAESTASDWTFHKAHDEGADPDRHLCDCLIQHRVRDLMWYKDVGLRIALARVPRECELVGLMDNDVVPMPPVDREDATEPGWWTDAISHAFRAQPLLQLLQPFSEVVLTTENVRNGLLGNAEDQEGTRAPPPASPPRAGATGPREGHDGGAHAGDGGGASTLSYEDAYDRCQAMLRVQPGAARAGGRGVHGCALVMRKHVLDTLGLFRHTYTGDGEATLLNLCLGATPGHANAPPVLAADTSSQRALFGPRSTYAKYVLRHHRMHKRLFKGPAQIGHLPCPLVHLYHGELATKATAAERHALLVQRDFNPQRHTVSVAETTELVEWSDAFRATGINAALRASFERSHSVREKALLRCAKVRHCMAELQTQVHALVHDDTRAASTEASAHNELAAMMQACLQAFRVQGI